jgi:putative endonuclease
MDLRAKGDSAENAAADYLAGMGYKIVQRNLNTRFGEIDIVAVDDGMVVFVEVKSRTSDEWGHPEDQVDRRKRQTLRRVAQLYLERHGLLDAPCRFDVVALTATPDGDDWDIELFQDAF